MLKYLIIKVPLWLCQQLKRWRIVSVKLSKDARKSSARLCVWRKNIKNGLLISRACFQRRQRGFCQRRFVTCLLPCLSSPRDLSNLCSPNHLDVTENIVGSSLESFCSFHRFYDWTVVENSAGMGSISGASPWGQKIWNGNVLRAAPVTFKFCLPVETL